MGSLDVTDALQRIHTPREVMQPAKVSGAGRLIQTGVESDVRQSSLSRGCTYRRSTTLVAVTLMWQRGQSSVSWEGWTMR